MTPPFIVPSKASCARFWNSILVFCSEHHKVEGTGELTSRFDCGLTASAQREIHISLHLRLKYSLISAMCSLECP